MDKFWVVFRPVGGSKPTYMHKTIISAKEEAERLAKDFPGFNFVVMEALEECSTTAPISWGVCD